MPENKPSSDQVAQTSTENPAPISSSVPSTSKGLAFKSITRQLTEDDLTNPGVTKLILEMLVAAEYERDDYKMYMAKYYDAERRACIAEEKLKSNKINEIMFSVMLCVGGTALGTVPTFDADLAKALITLGVAIVLISGAIIGRVLYK